MRMGVGFDVHRLGAERPLRLGGVEVPGSPGLIGHSDADCVLHAITDALLGAAALGDIGMHFPDDDPRYEGADSRDLLARAVGMVAEAGLRPVNVDCTVLAEGPRLAPYRDAMRRAIGAAVGLTEDRVGVKFTTLEGLGALGRGEGIACHAVCLLEKRREP